MIKGKKIFSIRAALLTLCLAALLTACGDAGKPDEVSGRPDDTPSPSPAPATESAKPTPEPEPWEEYQTKEITPEIQNRAAEILARLSTEEKIYQLFIVFPESVSGESLTASASDNMLAGLDAFPVGGLVFSTKNLVSREQTAQLISDCQSRAKTGLFIAADEEGGSVSRLMRKLDTTRLDAMFSYRHQGQGTAYENAGTIARDMRDLGFNTDFAPVADVWSNPDNTVIGDRAYSDDYREAAELVEAAVRGFADGGVICSLKHFPGHGDTFEDTHFKKAYVYKDEEELMENELLPFVAGLRAGADIVMTGHIIVPSLDDVQATVSHRIVTGLLRERLGFDGVISTDALTMAAVSEYTPGELAVRALAAGTDILLGPPDLWQSVSGIYDALESGELTIQRIDESVTRILCLKIQRGVIS